MSTVPQDPTKFGYRADAKVTLTGQEFIVLQHLAQKAIGNGVRESFVQVYEWVDVATGQEVAKPTQAQIQEGKVARVPSKVKTLQNKQVSYDSNVYPEIFDGNEVIFKVHMRNIEAGVATPVDVLQKEYQERQDAEAKKGQMTLVEDAPQGVDEQPDPATKEAAEAVDAEEVADAPAPQDEKAE